MKHKLPAVILCVAFLAVPGLSWGGSSDVSESSSWSTAIHKENDIWASILYLPYIVGRVPLGIISGIFDPKPTSQATIPPAAHQQHH